MTIAPLKKVTICGLAKEKREVLATLQSLGCMHLLPLRPPPKEVENVASPRAEAAYAGLRFLTTLPERRRQVVRDPTFDVEKLVKEALELKQHLREATDRRDFLAHRIADVEPWGDLLFPPEQSLAGYRLWFYILPLGRSRSLALVELPWQMVRKDNRFVYVVVIAREEPPGDLLPVPRIHTGALPVSELKVRLEDTEVEIEDLAARRLALTRYIYLLSVNLAEAENRASLAFADQQTREEEGVVAVQGWVPEDALPGVVEAAGRMRLACLVEEPGPDDDPPTLLEERPEMEAGLDLAMFYQVPGYRSWDPSLILVLSFAVFFAMILSDAGYAAVMLGGLLLFWKRLGKSGKGRSYRLLGMIVLGASLVWGVLVGSYFGVEPAEGSLPARAHLLNLNDFDTMMSISIFVGIAHLMLANLMNAYVNRRRLVALASIGWIVTLIGGILLWRVGPETAVGQAGYAFLAGGLLLSFLFSSERAVRRPADVLWRGLDGLKALTGALGMFGDVLSYMRLFALGLAAASLALTFNNLAGDVADAVPGLGLLLAILILIIGHALNLGLSIMSGVVHSLRLNFIEFYKWGLPAEGTAFRKFARKEVQP
jgi:V/A-type H+/Na+-transporting ATPase subunit I